MLEFLHLFLVHLVLFSGIVIDVVIGGIVIIIIVIVIIIIVNIINIIIIIIVNIINISIINIININIINIIIINNIIINIITLLLPMHHVRHLPLTPHPHTHLQQHFLVLRAEPARLHAAIQLELVLHVAQPRHLLPSRLPRGPTSRA